MNDEPLICAACGSANPPIVTIGGLRRTSCPSCHHSQRIDIEPFDYAGFAMGATGIAPARLAAQAAFIATRVPDGARALEIGCAAGDLAQELRRQRTFVAYDGVEFSPAREFAVKRLDRVFAKPLEALLSSGEIEAASYDLVLSSHCLEHLDDPSAMVAAMRSTMKPDGLLFRRNAQSQRQCAPAFRRQSFAYSFLWRVVINAPLVASRTGNRRCRDRCKA